MTKISKTHHKTKNGKIKLNPKKREDVLVFVCLECIGHDHYEEDEHSQYGNEIHSIKHECKIVKYEVPITKMEQFVRDYLHRDADNPPYDKYEIKLAYWKHNNEPYNMWKYI